MRFAVDDDDNDAGRSWGLRGLGSTGANQPRGGKPFRFDPIGTYRSRGRGQEPMASTPSSQLPSQVLLMTPLTLRLMCCSLLY